MIVFPPNASSASPLYLGHMCHRAASPGNEAKILCSSGEETPASKEFEGSGAILDVIGLTCLVIPLFQRFYKCIQDSTVSALPLRFSRRSWTALIQLQGGTKLKGQKYEEDLTRKAKGVSYCTAEKPNICKFSEGAFLCVDSSVAGSKCRTEGGASSSMVVVRAKFRLNNMRHL